MAEKSNLPALLAAIRSLLNEWDPVELIAIGAPDDEYDCLRDQLLTRLAQGQRPNEISTFLIGEIQGYFGVAPEDGAEHFAERLVRWYEEWTA